MFAPKNKDNNNEDDDAILLDEDDDKMEFKEVPASPAAKEKFDLPDIFVDNRSSEVESSRGSIKNINYSTHRWSGSVASSQMSSGKESMILKPITVDEDDVEILFQGQTVHQKARCCSRLLFNWAKPLIIFSNKTKKLVLEQYGELAPEEKIEVALRQLEATWNKKKLSGKKNVLFYTVFVAYKYKYIKIMFWNIIT